MRVNASIVPGFFTMANMFCGYYSTILSATAYGSGAGENRFVTAAWLIIAAAVLDVLDGKLARLTDSASDFGVQHDSLADVISFGLAPSTLAYYTFFYQWGTLGLLASFTPLVFGSIRLARFNVQSKGFHKDHFSGLPIPAAAVTICTFVLFNLEMWNQLRWSKVFFALILMVGLLMISNIRYEMMPNFKLGHGFANSLKIFLVVFCVIGIVFYPHSLFFPLSVMYILSGLLNAAIKAIKKNGQQPTESEDISK